MLSERFSHFLVISFVIICGVLFGKFLEPDENLPANYRVYSSILGWTYFFAWSISFYPQLFHNYLRGTSRGLSIDFIILNAIGFLCYSIFTVCMYYVPLFKDEYEARHHGNVIKVSISDVYFAIHAFVLTIITWMQAMYYDGHFQIPSQLGFLGSFAFLVFCAIYMLFIIEGVNNGRDPYNWYSFVYVIAISKVVVTCIKYPPQIITNYKMSNTVGFNILQILLDLMGCVLSLLQIVLDCYMTNDWVGLYGNPVKVYLSGIVFVYDMILLYQHYILYTNINNMLMEDPTLKNYTSNPVYYASIQNSLQMRNMSPPASVERMKQQQQRSYFDRFNILSNKPSVNVRSNEILADFDASMGASSLYFGNSVRSNPSGPGPASGPGNKLNYMHKPLAQDDSDEL